jgi:outer membrane protein assembly factor BamD
MRQSYRIAVLAVTLGTFVCSGQFLGLGKKKKYDTPITKDTLQPDKILFDRAIKDIEHGNYEVARLTLNTLINTYDTSEFIAKAKLAIADSWYREGGAHGLSQAEAEYKDFELFYPQMEEAAESQYKVCEIHYKQMEKADRDSAQAQHAEDECREMINRYPNSKYLGKAQQMLRETQEVLADKEFKTGEFYHHKGSFPAAANRLSYVAQQYPLYSGSDDALWDAADSYKQMGDRFENDEATALTKIVRDYPLSGYLEPAKERLTELKRPIPQADPTAYARMKYELENQSRPGIVSRTIAPFASRPDTSAAAKSGAPIMTSMRPPVPYSVPQSAAGNLPSGAAVPSATGVSDVSISANVNGTELDLKPDARLGTPAAAEPATAGLGEQKASQNANGQAVADAVEKPAAPVAVSNQSLPTNHPLTADQLKILKKQAQKAAAYQKKHPQVAKPPTTAAEATGTAPTATTPTAAGTTPAAAGAAPATGTTPPQ